MLEKVERQMGEWLNARKRMQEDTSKEERWTDRL